MTHSVRLGDVVALARDETSVSPDGDYRTAGILNRGRGLFERPPITGAETKYTKLFRLHEGQLVYSKLFGWEGSVAVVSQAFDGCFVSPEFPTFDADYSQIDRSYLGQIIRWDGFVEQLAGATTGMGQRRQRVNIEQFENVVIPLPELDEQRRIATHLDALESASALVRTANVTSQFAMRSLTQQLIASHAHAPRVALARVLRLDREWFEPEVGKSYDPVGVRGFGRGLIRYPPTPRAELPKLRFFRLHADRLVVSNIKAWEGAVAVTNESDANRIGSNRFLMYESDDAKADLSYLQAYLLSEEGLSQLQAGSPGSADRNRTLSISNFEAIEVPLPSIEAQRDVVRLLSARDRLAELVAEREKLAQALPASARNEIFSAMV